MVASLGRNRSCKINLSVTPPVLAPTLLHLGVTFSQTVVCKAKGLLASSCRPAQHHRDQTDGSLRAHFGGLVPTAAGQPGLSSIGIVLLMCFASVGAASFGMKDAKPCALIPSLNGGLKLLITRFLARCWAHGQLPRDFLNPQPTIAK